MAMLDEERISRGPLGLASMFCVGLLVGVGLSIGEESAQRPKPSAPKGWFDVLKASAGNLYSLSLSVTTVSGYVLVFNATSAPSNGAVTPVWWQVVNSNGTLGGLSAAWPASA